jgi:peptidoglycan hydrolase-like protein with peptidoglycan-binding domain
MKRFRTVPRCAITTLIPQPKGKPMNLKLLVLAVATVFSASVFAQANQGTKDKATTSQSPSSAGSSAQGSSAQGSSAAGASGAQAQAQQRDRVRDPAQQAQGMSADTVKQAQQALKDKGHDVGPIDGMYGPQTQKGVKEFQEKQNMKATGRLDQQTLSALGVQEGSSAVGAGADKKDTKDTKKKSTTKKEEGGKDKM